MAGEGEADGGKDLRVRLTLSPSGALAATREAIEGTFCGTAEEACARASSSGGGGGAVVVAALTPVHSRNPFLYHKTSDRRVYSEPREEALAAWRGKGGSSGSVGGGQQQQPDIFDVLLHNEHGHATEFTIGSLVVQRGSGGGLVTPPLGAGVLPGVYRSALLAEGVLREGTVTLEDAAHPDAQLWLVNSVRGWVKVRLWG